MSKDEIKLEYYRRLKTLNYIDLNEVLTQQLAKEMTEVHEQLLIHSVVKSLPSKEEVVFASETKSNHKYNELNSDLDIKEIEGFISGCNWYAERIKK